MMFWGWLNANEMEDDHQIFFLIDSQPTEWWIHPLDAFNIKREIAFGYRDLEFAFIF